MRRAIILVCAFDLAAWLAIAALLFGSGSDPATRGLDVAGGIVVTLLVALTALPASLLVRAHRAPRVALGLALAFPAALVFLVVVVAASLP